MGWITNRGWEWARAGALVILATVVLGACGGGGSPSSPDGSTPAQAGGLRLDRSSVNILTPLSDASGTEVIQVQGSDGRATQVVVGFVEDTPPNWLEVVPTGTWPNLQLQLRWNSNQVIGRRTITLRIATADAQDKVLNQLDVPVTFTVTPAYASPGIATGTDTSPNGVVQFHPSLSQFDAQTYTSATDRLTLSSVMRVTDSRVATMVTGAPFGDHLPAWIKPSLVRTSDGWTLQATLDASQIRNNGLYTTTVRVAALNAAGLSLGQLDIPVKLQVLARAGMMATTYKGISSQTTPLDASVYLFAPGLQWQATATSDLPVTLKTTQGQGTTDIGLAVDLSHATVGTHEVRIDLTTTDGQHTSESIPVLVRAPKFFLNPTLSSEVNETVVITPWDLSGINGMGFKPEVFRLALNTGEDINVNVSSDAPWLKVIRTGTLLSSGFSLQPDPSVGPLASGSYQATVTLSGSSNGSPVSLRLPVNFTLTAPVMSASQPRLTLGGAAGRDLTAADLNVLLNQPLSNVGWKLASWPAWVAPSRTDGSFASNNNGLSLRLAAGVAKPGVATGTLVFNAQINGDKLSVNVPVEGHLDVHRLLPDKVGIALVSLQGTAGWSRLTDSIPVRDNMGLRSPWTASSDQAWLQVSASGVAGDALQLTANAAGLSLNTLYTATVTLASTDATVATPEKIRVGLWVGQTAPTATWTLPQTTANRVVPDPVRPLLYALGPNGRDLKVYNLYTGAPRGSLANVLGAGVTSEGALVAPDGSRLYVHNGPGSTVVVDIGNADAPRVLATWPVTLTPDVATVGRVNGQLTLVSKGQAIDGLTGAVLRSDLWQAGQVLMATPFNATDGIGFPLYGCTLSDIPGTLWLWRIDRSAGATSAFSFSEWTHTTRQTNILGRDLAVSPDGFQVASFTSNTNNSDSIAFGNKGELDLSSLWLMDGAPSNVAYTPDGRPLGLSADGQQVKLWAFPVPNKGQTLRSQVIGSEPGWRPADRSMHVSGDGHHVVVPATSASMHIVPVAP
jgi:hypothetical protein